MTRSETTARTAHGVARGWCGCGRKTTVAHRICVAAVIAACVHGLHRADWTYWLPRWAPDVCDESVAVSVPCACRGGASASAEPLAAWRPADGRAATRPASDATRRLLV